MPTLNLDDRYSQAQPKDSKIKPENYKLNSLTGFKLNCSSYDFSLIRSLNGGKDPDAIFIVCKAGNYMVAFNRTKVTTVDKTTMTCIDQKDKIFTGFERGDTPIIAIGTLEIKDEKADMKSFWVGMLDIK